MTGLIIQNARIKFKFHSKYVANRLETRLTKFIYSNNEMCFHLYENWKKLLCQNTDDFILWLIKA